MEHPDGDSQAKGRGGDVSTKGFDYQGYKDIMEGLRTAQEDAINDRAKRLGIIYWPQEGTFYVCRFCGYHKNNRATWCGAGCGSDYNQMLKVVAS